VLSVAKIENQIDSGVEAGITHMANWGTRVCQSVGSEPGKIVARARQRFGSDYVRVRVRVPETQPEATWRQVRGFKFFLLHSLLLKPWQDNRPSAVNATAFRDLIAERRRMEGD
jgi:hypothetical protein